MPTKNVLTEEVFQRLIIDALVEDQGYKERIAKTDYNAAYAMDVDILLKFLRETQPKSMDRLERVYDGRYEEIVVGTINDDIAERGLLTCLWDGVDFDCGVNLDLVYPKPSASFDQAYLANYDANALTVMEEVYHKEDERIDLVIFLNGLALFAFELKCPSAGTSWTYRRAIDQYKNERDPSTRLLKPKVGVLAAFAMDTEEVYVCSELMGRESNFLPFNQGRPSDDPRATTAGNPVPEAGHIATEYMWEKVLAKDSVLDLVYNYCYVETERDKKTRKVVERTQIFPRYQQLRAVRRIEADMARADGMSNYLVEHSAGSGKTKTISWLAHHLSRLYHQGSTEPMFDKVIVVTDRLVVDEQLQDAVQDMAHDPSIVTVMDKGRTSDDLGSALEGGYRVIVTTIQKFLYLDQGAFEGTDKRFAVIIDEAQGSTSGMAMQSVNATLTNSTDDTESSSLDQVTNFIRGDIRRTGRQANVAMIGFTATPTAKNLRMFGRRDEDGKWEPYDLYTMEQAISEGFVLDVTANYLTYKTYVKVEKSIEDDPEFETKAARRKLAAYINASDASVNGKLSIMMEHFATRVAPMLKGRAKCMVVASSREAAVKYRLAYSKLQEKDPALYGKLGACVAFTGDIVLDGTKYTEVGMNGVSEDKLPDLFDTDGYRILFVADKYQTGFDQPYLTAMYVDKRLSGIPCVQTLSRLNRICPPYDKRPMVLDFENSYDDIRESFAPYYGATCMRDSLTISDVRETERKLMGFNVIDSADVRSFNATLAKSKLTTKDKKVLWSILTHEKSLAEELDEDEQDEFRRTLRNFLRQYGFILQVTYLVNERMHEEYNLGTNLIRVLEQGHGAIDFTIADKVSINGFEAEKTSEHTAEKGEESDLVSKPVIGFPKGTGTGPGLTKDQFARLSEIIADWNARFGKNFDIDIAAGGLVSLQGSMMKNGKVRRSALVNSKSDFTNTVDDNTEATLVDGYSQNEDWYGFLLNNEDARRQLVHAFVDDMYRDIRQQNRH